MVILKTNRTHYNDTEAEKNSMTVGKMIEILEGFNPNEKIIFSNDNGYTYGYVDESVIKQK